MTIREYYKQNRLFCLLVAAAIFFGILFAYLAGFEKMILQTSSASERLKNITFPIWEAHSFDRHGFLVFLSPEDFAKGRAYSNHSTAYLFLMYALYKVETAIPILPMRLTSALLNMLFFAAALVFVSLSEKQNKPSFSEGVVFIFSVIFVITMPGFWISAGKFNVDNPFTFLFPLVLVISFIASHNNYSEKTLWLWISILGIFAPFASVLLGGALLCLSFNEGRVCRKKRTSSFIAIFAGLVCYLQPVLTSRFLGFSSANSSLLFRSGLDGQTEYFSNVFNSVFYPFFPRPMYLLLVPTLFLCVRLRALAWNKSRESSFQPSMPSNARTFYALLFSLYVINCLFWPQAVSIHPYLYDHLLLAPIGVAIVLAFWGAPDVKNTWRMWAAVLLFLIVFNLQQIAQAGRCVKCFYPTWSANQLHL